jgi:hypothetical protein
MVFLHGSFKRHGLLLVMIFVKLSLNFLSMGSS